MCYTPRPFTSSSRIVTHFSIVCYHRGSQGRHWRDPTALHTGGGVVVRCLFWIFGWGCGCSSRWAARGGEGGGGGALGSSHSAHDRRRNSTHSRHTPSICFFAGQRICTPGGCDADMFEIPGLKRRPVRIGGATGKLWGPSTRRSAGGRVREIASTSLGHRGSWVV